MQVPWFPPQVAPAATQVVPAQQPLEPHVAFAQHACPAPPHAVNVPALHTMPAAPFAPSGMQVLLVVSRHAPPLQVVPAQGGWNAPPQVVQLPALHTLVPLQVVPPQHGWPSPPQPAQAPVARHWSPRPQVVPVLTQRLVPLASQQPPVQVLPAQHGWPTPPQAWQRLPPHTVPAPQAWPGQQG